MNIINPGNVSGIYGGLIGTDQNADATTTATQNVNVVLVKPTTATALNGVTMPAAQDLVVPIAGNYLFTGAAQIGVVGSTVRGLNLFAYVDGVEYCVLCQAGVSNAGMNMGFGTILTLAAGEKVELWAENFSSSDNITCRTLTSNIIRIS